MEWERLSTDSIEEQLADDEQLISRLRGRQMACLAELDTRQIAAADGSRSLSEWVSARLDQGMETARTLVRTMRRLQDRPDLRGHISNGNVSFDRVEALSKLEHREPDDLLLWPMSPVSIVKRPNRSVSLRRRR